MVEGLKNVMNEGDPQTQDLMRRCFDKETGLRSGYEYDLDQTHAEAVNDGTKISLQDEKFCMPTRYCAKVVSEEHNISTFSMDAWETIFVEGSGDDILTPGDEYEGNRNIRDIAQSPKFRSEQMQKLEVLEGDVEILKLKLAETMMYSNITEGDDSILNRLGKDLDKMIVEEDFENLNKFLVCSPENSPLEKIEYALKNIKHLKSPDDRLICKKREIRDSKKLLLKAEILVLSKAIEIYGSDKKDSPDKASKKNATCFLSRYFPVTVRRAIPQAEKVQKALEFSHTIQARNVRSVTKGILPSSRLFSTAKKVKIACGVQGAFSNLASESGTLPSISG